jgi:hypothetical protein
MPFDERYTRDLDRGLTFERHIAGLLKVDWSSDFEERTGLECKLDDMYSMTGNLFVEVEERPTVLQEWKPAGIHHRTCPTIYLQGDLSTFWIFDTAVLRSRSQNARVIPNRTNTGRGFLLTCSEADRLAAYVHHALKELSNG